MMFNINTVVVATMMLLAALASVDKVAAEATVRRRVKSANNDPPPPPPPKSSKKNSKKNPPTEEPTEAPTKSLPTTTTNLLQLDTNGCYKNGKHACARGKECYDNADCAFLGPKHTACCFIHYPGINKCGNEGFFTICVGGHVDPISF